LKRDAELPDRQLLRKLCARHLKDLREHENWPRDLALKPAPARFSPPEASSGSSSPFAWRELAG